MLSTSALASIGGGWVGSGGGSFLDEHNPWFLRNVSQVSYCIDLDVATFSATLDQSRSAIQGAIQYWKNQFSTVQAVQNVVSSGSVGSSVAQVGTQTFSEVDCTTGNPDIRFVLGYGKLAPDEIAFFTDPNNPDASVQNYIGVTVRTDYDPVQLRGKGFVYISSDLGSHIYQNDGNLIAPAWSKPNLLNYALIHEMGHVFGFPHTGTSIMSEVFLEQILEEHLTYLFQSSPVNPFLFPGPAIDDCFFMPNQSSWFAIPSGSNCVQADFSDLRNIRLSAHAQGSSAMTPVGTIQGLDVSVLGDFRSSPGIFVHLTSKQAIFTQQEASFRAFMVGPGFVDFGATANFVPANGGVAKPVYLRFTSSSFTITGQSSANKLEILYSYESPVDVLLTQPPSPR